MVYYALRIGNWNAKIMPIKAVEDLDYENVDENKNPLSWIKGTAQRGYYTNIKGEKVEKGYKLINGEVFDKFEKTTEILENEYDEVDLSEVNNIMKELYYYVECDNLKQQLIDSNKALRFIYTNGNGFKRYMAYVYLFENALIMCLGRGYLSGQIRKIDDEGAAKRVLEEIRGVKVKKARANQMALVMEQ